MNAKELQILISLAEYGAIECPWAWASDVNYDEEEANKAMVAAREELARLEQDEEG